ncbi:MAG: response regulator [Gammaproteobacteria bacterium]|nr:response regulator [Gammaproteobacteria bacterium]
MSEPSILVVDDDPGLRELLQRYLRAQEFAVTAVGDGEAMQTHLAQHSVDLIILDVMLPGEDGLTLARRLCNNDEIPVIMLSARGEDMDRIIGIEVGADDYLAKPFNPRELLARIRAVLRRRTQRAPSLPQTPAAPHAYRFGPFELDAAAHRLTCDGEEIRLTNADFKLLHAFVTHPNKVLSRDALMDILKGYERSPFDRSIDVRVTRLRRKIEADPADPAYICTIWGEGYLFSPEGRSR